MVALWFIQARGLENDISAINNGVFDYLKVLFVLAGILALAFFVLRFWLPKLTGLKQLSSGPIRVAARHSLEAGKTLYIVSAGSEYFLVGTSESGMHFLTALDSSRVESALVQPPQSDDVLHFSNLVKNFRKRPSG